MDECWRENGSHIESFSGFHAWGRATQEKGANMVNITNVIKALFRFGCVIIKISYIFLKIESLRLTLEGVIIFASAVNNNYED